MKPKPSLSSIKRIFFSPVNEEKFVELRDRDRQQIQQVDLFNIR